MTSSLRQGALHGVRSEQSNKGRLRQIRQTQSRQSHYSTVKYRKLASKQIGQTEIIVYAVAIQTMATTSMARQENAGIKMRGPIMNQPTFNWRAQDKYEGL